MDLAALKQLTDQYLPLMQQDHGTVTRGLAFMVTVRSEADGRLLADRLARQGYTNLGLREVRILLRKRWRVSGLSYPVEYTAAAIHRWLDSLDTEARNQRAVLETWAPSE